MNEILSVWNSLTERRKAALAAMALWLVFGWAIGIWRDDD